MNNNLDFLTIFTHIEQWLSWCGGSGKILEYLWKFPGLGERDRADYRNFTILAPSWICSLLAEEVFHSRTSEYQCLTRTLAGHSEGAWEIAMACNLLNGSNSDNKGKGRKGICFQLWNKNPAKSYNRFGDHPLGGKAVLCWLNVIQGSGLLRTGNSSGLCYTDIKKCKKIWSFIHNSFLPCPANVIAGCSSCL